MRSRARMLSPLFIVVLTVISMVPFAFMFLTASKNQAEAAELGFSLPTNWTLFSNIVDAIQARDYMLLTAFVNSIIVTVVSVGVLVILSAMVAYVLQRRRSRWTKVADLLILSGLIIPPAVVPTVWVLQE